MKVLDLGQLDGPVLLFGGPYSNLQALEAIIAEAERRGIVAKNTICTGDTVAYCANPSETVALIREFGCAVVAGNCEKQLAAHATDCGCGFEEGTQCDLLSAGWYGHADRHIGTEDRNWMAGLPDMITFTHLGQRNAVIHGGLSDVSRFIWAVSGQAEFEQEISLVRDALGSVNRIISGHCGMAFTRIIDGVEWLNAGVIGMPANNGVPLTEYAVLQGGQSEIANLTYDYNAAYEAMCAAGLIQGYHKALLSGYWPSEEVLPSSLRKAAS